MWSAHETGAPQRHAVQRGKRMDTQGIDQLLAQMRTAAAMAAGDKPSSASAAAGADAPDFAAILKGSLDQVNAQQQQADSMAKQYELGNPDVPLHEVMMSLQKANLSFQTMVQVRNRLVTAYQEVMNMPV